MTKLAVFLLFCWTDKCLCWRRWNYSYTPTPSTEDLFQIWKQTWGQRDLNGNLTNAAEMMHGPRPRRGHSLIVINEYLVMFGGRDNDQPHEYHIPKTYNVETVNGTTVFTTYDKKPVTACLDLNNDYYSTEETKGCSVNATLITVAKIYNDVWAYNLNCTRYFDGPCADSGWELWNPGATQGGCVMELGIQVCYFPSERYDHEAVYFDDGMMYVYGGYSQRCGDYCDDMWLFDIYTKQWSQVNGSGELSHIQQFEDSHRWGGPGKRWRFTMLQDEKYLGYNGKYYQRFIVFGGHRLWQGFAPENSAANQWSNDTTYPSGGYLSDFWVYTRVLDFTSPVGVGFRLTAGNWTQIQGVQVCQLEPGPAWSQRNDVSCAITWPPPRAGHSAALDHERNLMWIFGGYTSYYPYLSTDGAGAGPGTQTGTGGFVPYPTYTYYLNDMWYYNFTSGLWTEVTFPSSAAVPAARFNHVMILRREVLFMYGGQGNNVLYDDTWYFNLTTFTWLPKSADVYPIYPAACTDDLEYIEELNCTHLQYPKHLERSSFAGDNFKILDANQQPYYYPNPAYGSYWGIFDKGFVATVGTISRPADYTPIFPYAATGPLQYATPVIIGYNKSENITVYERCTSVFSETTRGQVLDGKAGRSSSPVMIAQPRRRHPGITVYNYHIPSPAIYVSDWDGCRDRADGRTDLPNVLMYIHPLARSERKELTMSTIYVSVYLNLNSGGNPTKVHYSVKLESGNRTGHQAVMYSFNGSDQIFMYGGLAYDNEHVLNYGVSYYTHVSDEMWYFQFEVCINNCSFHGDCYYGFCRCWDGYYGIDCSNISCPGTFCYYDENTNEQICVHACQAGYNHTDNDVYVEDLRKVPCSQGQYGEVNGICDGFGNAYCAPPFIGEDCSIRDCKSNCSFNGWCSVEYPVSRCICNPGYLGEICELKYCLNNCSYPNGQCDSSTGKCSCNMMYSPYNNTREYYPWDGEDCSYLFPYAAASSLSYPLYLAVGTVMALIYYHVIDELG